MAALSSSMNQYKTSCTVANAAATASAHAAGLHSHCFFNNGRYQSVPGIDMCNYSSTDTTLSLLLLLPMLQVLHSRCFFNNGRHLAVPGIDMCNHSSIAPNAGVRLIHSPGACQGLSALEEVAPAAAEAGLVTMSYFQLVAGEPWGVLLHSTYHIYVTYVTQGNMIPRRDCSLLSPKRQASD